MLGEPRVWSFWELVVPGPLFLFISFLAKGSGPGCVWGFLMVHLREIAVAGAWQPDLSLASAKGRGVQILLATLVFGRSFRQPVSSTRPSPSRLLCFLFSVCGLINVDNSLLELSVCLCLAAC